MNRMNPKILSVAVAALALPALSLPAHAASVQSVKTIVTCQQSDGDQWVEAGIAEEGASLQAYVVSNNADDGSSKLLAKIEVREVTSGTTHAYMDAKGSFGLFVRGSGPGAPEAKLIYVDEKAKASKSDSISEAGLVCYSNTRLVYDSK